MKAIYSKYTWIGNRVSKEDMQKLYKLKHLTKVTITKMVAEAITLYLSEKLKGKEI